MADDSFHLSTDAELAGEIERAIDEWDTQPSPSERERIMAEYVAEQRAWQRKLASLSADERARVAAADAAEAEARLAEKKRGLIRAEAARLHVVQLKSEAERIYLRAEARVRQRTSPLMSSGEIDTLAAEEADRAEAELRAWVAAHPPPTLADDEHAIEDLIGA
jgi:hypothetical protein